MERIFNGYGRKISEPFTGIGISFKQSEWNFDTEETKDKLLLLSKDISSTLVYLDYQTWAGPCDCCYGLVCQEGLVIQEQEKEGEEGSEVLKQAISFLGVNMSTGYFAPFERGFFPNT